MAASILLTMILGVFGIILIANFIRIVPEYRRLVFFTLGRFSGTRGPGLIFKIPVYHSVVDVDLREAFIDVERQTCITRDNASIDIDFLLYFKVFDPEKTVVQVKDFAGAARGIAMTTLRAVVGDIPLDDCLAKRDTINEMLRSKLDEVTERWGVKVTNVEIKEVLPPREISDAMNKQMSAERHRRAIVTEAEGTREAAITVAQGEKQSAILKAEGARQAVILAAEARKQKDILEADGYAAALAAIFAAASKIDDKTMSLQYLETLQKMAESPSAKWIIPAEWTSLGQALGNAMKKS